MLAKQNQWHLVKVAAVDAVASAAAAAADPAAEAVGNQLADTKKRAWLYAGLFFAQNSTLKKS